MNEHKERNYNFIFEDLVTEPDDLVGILAYGIYKREKIDYIKDFKESSGHSPSDEELSDFHRASRARVHQYTALAEMSLAELQTELTANEYERLSRDFEGRLTEELRRAKTSWIAAITQGFLVSVVFTFFIGFFVVILIGWRSGINYILEEGVKVLTGK